MKLTLGFSPCPNDTFIFDAMVHGRVDTEGITFDYFLADVEELNRKAFIAEVDITKISYHAFAYAAKDYYILDSGSALGYKSGPLVITKTRINPDDFSALNIAIPGKFTTANLLMSIAWPEATHKTEYVFSDIERAVLSGEVDAGLIIHETRFTYQSKGLFKFADMGEYWERLTGLPIPLGSIVIKRSIPEDVALKVNRILKRSIDYAYLDSQASYSFVSQNAKTMDRVVMNNHIKLFVNEFTSNLGHDGRKAVKTLYSIAMEKNVIPELPVNIFLTDGNQ
jgi:1,4-dihydroxy-6-naphthoate synthase